MCIKGAQVANLTLYMLLEFLCPSRNWRVSFSMLHMV